MQLSSMPYFIPSTLSKERDLTIIKCNLLIEAFSELCKEEEIRMKEEIQRKAVRRIYDYSILDIGDGWSVLYKQAIPETRMNTDDDIQWSIPFKIINSVLIHRQHAYEGRSWGNANKLIPQGLFDGDINEINKDW